MTVAYVSMPGGMRHAVSKHDSRYAILGVECRTGRTAEGAADGVYVTATDGHVLAVRKVEGEGFDEPVLVPAELLQTRKNGDKIIHKNGRLESVFGSRIADPIEATFPPCVDILPEVGEKYRAIGLNAKLLWNLARAICDPVNETHIVLLIPPDPHKSIPVLAMDPGDGFGVIMPVRVDGEPTVDWEKRRADYTGAVNGKATPAAAG